VKNDNVAIQVFYFFSVLAGLMCLLFACLNFSEINHIQNNNPDFYVFLPQKQGLYYSSIWACVFTLLFGGLCYGYIKKSGKAVAVAMVSIIVSLVLSVYLYHYLTDFAEYGV
jgi:hypothetical protein